MISSSIQTLSLKCLLAGLIALYSFTSVAALPLQSRSAEEYDELFTRALSHPAGNANFPLFHGTVAQYEAALKVPDISKSHTEGDLHSKCGGLYLTDSLIAAAQFVCWQEGRPPTTTAHVLMYDWSPPSTIKIHATKTVEEQAAAAKTCKAYDMLTGPMYNKFLTSDFWQYALLNQNIATASLKYRKTFVIPCSKVFKGRNLPSADYEKGQGLNAGFTAYAKTLTG
ncbi:hypothetical protein MD484_g4923, partial [Candolleomyces efflorescens]